MDLSFAIIEFSLVSLFIRAPDLGFLKPLFRLSETLMQ